MTSADWPLLFWGCIVWGIVFAIFVGIPRFAALFWYWEKIDPSEPAESVISRMREVLDQMREAAKNADSLVTEMTHIAAERARQVENLEAAVGRDPGFGLLELSHLARALNQMREAAKNADSLVTEMTRMAAAKVASAEKLEAALSQMETKNSELEARFATVTKAPPAAIHQFAAMLADRERKNSRRDRRFFVAGLVVPAVITLVITAWFR
jgi:hypothetical protein